MRTLIMGAGLLMIVGFASCEKDHHCVCFDSANAERQRYTYTGTDREEAREMCSQAAIDLNESDTTETYICTLE